MQYREIEWIVCTMIDWEGFEDKEGVNYCIRYYTGSTSGGNGCKNDDHGFRNIGVIFLLEMWKQDVGIYIYEEPSQEIKIG